MPFGYPLIVDGRPVTQPFTLVHAPPGYSPMPVVQGPPGTAGLGKFSLSFKAKAKGGSGLRLFRKRSSAEKAAKKAKRKEKKEARKAKRAHKKAVRKERKHIRAQKRKKVLKTATWILAPGASAVVKAGKKIKVKGKARANVSASANISASARGRSTIPGANTGRSTSSAATPTWGSGLSFRQALEKARSKSRSPAAVDWTKAIKSTPKAKAAAAAARAAAAAAPMVDESAMIPGQEAVVEEGGISPAVKIGVLLAALALVGGGAYLMFGRKSAPAASGPTRTASMRTARASVRKNRRSRSRCRYC